MLNWYRIAAPIGIVSPSSRYIQLPILLDSFCVMILLTMPAQIQKHPHYIVV